MARLTASSERGQSTGEVAIRFVCAYSHMRFDDPIVFPGQVGRTHLHTFFGNTGTDANSTTASIAGSGNSTCAGGILNRSAYWVPSVIDTRTGTPVRPDSMVVYYKANGFNNVVQPMPAGLRMIAGDAARSTPYANVNPDGNYDWYCEDGASGSGQSISPTCSARTDWSPNVGAMRLAVIFPRCWDGRNLDSPDHKSHMAFPSGTSCPASHPVSIPEISINVFWPVRVANETRYWRLASDNYPSSIPGGYSSHADWWNGWDQSIVNRWNTNCLRAGVDCPIANLNDGWALN